MAGNAPPYFTDDYLKSLGLTYEEALEALKSAFRRRHADLDPVTPKVGLHPGDGRFFHAMPALLDDIAVVKWIVSTPEAAAAGKYIHGQLIASHAFKGHTLAIMDFAFGTGLRTAAVSALAAEYWSDPTSSTVAMIGCGLQARTHLDALLAVRPISRVIAVSRRQETAERYAEEVRARGIEAVIAGPQDDAIYEADIIASLVPVNMTEPPFLDGQRVKPGALALGVDLATAWIPETLGVFDSFTTDDASQTEKLVAAGMVKVKRPLDSDLAAASVGKSTVSWSPERRILCVPPGIALADAAIVRTILQKTGILEERDKA